MRNDLTIIQKEFYIKSLFSVIYKDWPLNEIARTSKKIIKRNTDVFICVLEGEAAYEVDNRLFHLTTGDVLYISGGRTYRRYILSEVYRNIYVDFHFDKPDHQILPCAYFPAIKGIDSSFIKLYKKWTFRNSPYQSECMSLMYNIYAHMISSEILSYIPNSKREVFEAAIRIISDSYTSEDLSVAMLAAKAQMSEVYFRKCFRKIYGVSPQQYIIDLRIAHAKELLQYHIDTINDIAQTCGFHDSCYFSRLFKQKTGYTPTEYKKAFGIE